MRNNGKLQPIRVQQVREGTFEALKDMVLRSNPVAFGAHFKTPKVVRRAEHLQLFIERSVQ